VTVASFISVILMIGDAIGGSEKLGLKGKGKVDIIDLKCDPILIGSLIRNNGYLPAYHMSKKSWITVLLDGSAPDEEIKDLIHLSFEIVDKK
jgi:predicted DNA-binding protein (MmcQ/YjbR family)